MFKQERTPSSAIRKLRIARKDGVQSEELISEFMKYTGYELVPLRVTNTSFKLKIYRRKCATESKFWQNYSPNDDNTCETISGVLFYYNNDHDRIYARTTNFGHFVIRKNLDHKFAMRVTAEFLSREGRKAFGIKHLFGNVRRTKRQLVIPENNKHMEPIIYDYYTANLDENASVWSIPCLKRIKNRNKMVAAVSTAFVQFRKCFYENDYFEIIECLDALDQKVQREIEAGVVRSSVYDSEVQCIDDLEDLVEKLQTEMLEMLKNRFNDESAEITMSFSYRELNDFYCTNVFNLKYKGKLVHRFVECPKLEEILRRLKFFITDSNQLEEDNASEEDNDLEEDHALKIFKDILKNTKVIFKASHKKLPYNYELLRCVEGDLYHEGKIYWRFSSKWYQLHENYANSIEKTFRECLNKCLVPVDDVAQLPLPWPELKTQN